MKIAAALTGCAIVSAGADAIAFCDPWSDPLSFPPDYPPNAALLFDPVAELPAVAVEGEAAQLVPANVPGLYTFFIDPLPEPGDHAVFSNSLVPPIEVQMVEYDLTPPVLASPLYFDLQLQYWANLGHPAEDFLDGSVQRVSKGGGSPYTIASNEPETGAVAVDKSNVYWTIRSERLWDQAAIRKAPNIGGRATTLVEAPYAADLAVDSEAVYFSTWTTGGSPPNGSIMRVSPDGGSPISIAHEAIGGPIALDNDCIYWLTEDAIVRAPKTGGPSAIVVSEVYTFDVIDLTVDHDGIYWTSYDEGKVYTATFLTH